MVIRYGRSKEIGTGKEKPVSVLDYTENILGVYLKNEHL
jgi:hypothetical protein